MSFSSQMRTVCSCLTTAAFNFFSTSCRWVFNNASASAKTLGLLLFNTLARQTFHAPMGTGS